MVDFLTDIARFTHFIGFALGIGAGSFADFSILRKINTDITTCDLGNLETVHKIVWAGLALLWISGIAILFEQTGLIISEFTPKLITKLTIVAILTANAFMLGVWAMPILKKNVNRPYIAFSLEHKTILSLLASISICSWISGLILGVFSALRPADFEFILPIFIIFYTLAIFGSIVTTVIMHIIWERRIRAYREKNAAWPKQEARIETTNQPNHVNGTNKTEKSIETIAHGNA